MDRILPANVDGYVQDNAIVFVNIATSNVGEEEDIGLLIDDNRLFTKRQLFQTNGEKLTFHASANLTLEDNYAVAANAKIDFIEAMDAGKITLNDSLGNAAVVFDSDTQRSGATVTGANVVGDGSLRFKDGEAFALLDDATIHLRTKGASGADFILEGTELEGNASLNVPLKVDDITEFGTGQGLTFGEHLDFKTTLNANTTSSETELTVHKQPLLITGDSAGAGNTELLLAEGNVASDSFRLERIYGRPAPTSAWSCWATRAACASRTPRPTAWWRRSTTPPASGRAPTWRPPRRWC